MSFENELEKGQFYLPKCLSCEKWVWPPSEFCDRCNGKTSLKKEEFKGKIIEFSRQNDNMSKKKPNSKNFKMWNRQRELFFSHYLNFVKM